MVKIMYTDDFSKRITQLRLNKGVSARDMSLSLGQSESYINRIENKQMLPSMTVFFYICDYFKITPKEFFEEDNTSPTLLNDVVNELKQLNENQLLNIYNVIKDINHK